MKLKYDDIIDKHKNTPCVVSGHGPSLNCVKTQIQKLQVEKQIMRISVNNWFDYYDIPPDYWVLSNGEFTLQSGLLNDRWWQHRGYPLDAYNLFNVPVFFADVADTTDYTLIEKHAQFDYFPYDTRHFKGHDCLQILNNFRKYYDKNQNLNFDYYGNNTYMWKPADKKAYEEVQCDPVFMSYPVASWSKTRKCCHRIDSSRVTLQEELQEYTQNEQHYSTGHTVSIFALSFAVLMGCNPIYIVGVDLDYWQGYANNNKKTERFIPRGAMGHFKVLGKHIQNDFDIINASAKKKGVQIINLNKDAWYNSFIKGDINE